MTEIVAPFPLQWPVGFPRTPHQRRTRASFSTTRHSQAGLKSQAHLTVADAMERLQRQIDLLGGHAAVLSTNIPPRLDGRPRSGLAEPDDPGAALYFQLRGRATAMPCDRFDRVADNVAAIAHHIDAVRRIERYGVGTVEQMFAGFQAIRGPGPKPWRETFGFKAAEPVTRDAVVQRHREMAKRIHPDIAGDGIPGADAAMAEINAARDAALQELRL